MPRLIAFTHLVNSEAMMNIKFAVLRAKFALLFFIPIFSLLAFSIGIKTNEAKETLYKDKLVIPSIGINAPVKLEGLENGKMAVPNNLKQVGLYEFGAMPGEMGSAVMAAHVDNGAGTPGIFYNLKKLEAGDKIFYYDKNGREVIFSVKKKKIYDQNEDSTGEIFSRDDSRSLNLITCYGKWIPSEKTYSERLVVFTELI